jgi:16S rRNA (uracil1498-N3)-methyltransferase
LPEAAPAFVWVEELADPGERLALGPDASRHVAKVCRARVGETLSITDGRGGLASAVIESLAPRVTARIEHVEREAPSDEAVLLCGATEGPRFDWVVEKLAEMGVRRIRPVHSDRGRWEGAAVRPERWARLARAGLEQSRGRFLLSVEPPAELAEALEREGGAATLVVADPSGAAAGTVGSGGASTVVGVVGPSAGLSAAELTSLVSRGATLICLAASRLRTETAAICWAAWWARTRGHQG